LQQYEAQTVGNSTHRELWVPSGELDAFNAHIKKPIALERAFFGPTFRGYIPERFGLKGADAFEQITRMVGTFKYSLFDFHCEVAANATVFFLHFPFWKLAGADRLSVSPVDLEACLNRIERIGAERPRSAPLLGEAIAV
jgi:hypothetical protein